MRVVLGSLLAGMLACGAVAPVAAEIVCVHYDDYCSNSLAMCRYAETNKRVFLAWGSGSLLLKPIPPATELPPRPTKITSCDAVKKEPPKGYCEATLCGPTNASPGLTPFNDKARDPAKSATPPCGGPGNPCPRRPSGVTGEGLLEGDPGLATQGPAQTGPRSGSSR